MNTTTLELGHIVATAGVDAWFTPERRVAVAQCILSHQSGDWGDVCEEDAALPQGQDGVLQMIGLV